MSCAPFQPLMHLDQQPTEQPSPLWQSRTKSERPESVRCRALGSCWSFGMRPSCRACQDSIDFHEASLNHCWQGATPPPPLHQSHRSTKNPDPMQFCPCVCVALRAFALGTCHQHRPQRPAGNYALIAGVFSPWGAGRSALRPTGRGSRKRPLPPHVALAFWLLATGGGEFVLQTKGLRADPSLSNGLSVTK